jgi:hypothetical protein
LQLRRIDSSFFTTEELGGMIFASCRHRSLPSEHIPAD